MRHCAGLVATLALLAGCVTQHVQPPPLHRPDDVRAEIVHLMPAQAVDRRGWAVDIYAAFAAQDIEPTTANLCAVLAVADQESNFNVDPIVPGLPKIARAEIDRRAASMHVPQLLVSAALLIDSPNGKSYRERLEHVRTERDMSRMFEDFIGMVPMGRRLFGGLNPVHTAGPMQVSITFAEAHAKNYPYPVDGSIRHELFTRRGSVYFGVLHLLGYRAHYAKPLYRFADFNAGWYASRNAAFQNAVSRASGIPLALDGDIFEPDSDFDRPGQTELALRSLRRQLDMSDRQIRRSLEQPRRPEFEDTDLYTRVFALADTIERKPLPRAMVPVIRLESPKITRKLTTSWYATRVDGRYQRCMQKAL
ncbi:MAG: DUF1615 domain-containing protein [Dokdonella sp.]